MVDVEVSGYFIACPHCERELRIHRKYAGRDVACKFCRGRFRMDPSHPRIRTRAFYTQCPHCDYELRVAPKYLGMKVVCKFCNGPVQVIAAKRSVRPAASRPAQRSPQPRRGSSR